MPTKCLVWHCTNTRRKGINAHFFKLTSSRSQAWLSALGRDPNEEISNNAAICSEHFQKEDTYEKLGLWFVKVGAVPSLNLRKGSSTTSTTSRVSTNKRKRKQVSKSSTTSDSEGLKGTPKGLTECVRLLHNYSATEMDTKHGVFENMEKISRGHTTIGHKCRLCLYRFTSLISMNNHFMRHKLEQNFFDCENGNMEKYCCRECDFTTYLTIHYTQHIVDLHVNKLKECKFETNFILNRFQHVTNSCLLEYERLFQWRHTTGGKRREVKIKKCDHCDYKTERWEHLKRHHVSKHLPDDEINWFECLQCIYKSKAKPCLARHIKRKHSNDDRSDCKWFKCNHCDFKTAKKVNLTRHQTVRHTPEDEINWSECQQCDFKAKTKSYLTMHIQRRHLKVKSLV